MKMKSTVLAIAFTLSMLLSLEAAEKRVPVRMGNGSMTFETVPGWGLDENGKSVLGPTHGSFWDKDGNLYVQDWNVSGRLMKLVRVK